MDRPTAETDHALTRQIQICRVICIFFMMSVHVHPGIWHASIVSSDGAYALIGRIWALDLGRASVAALSFVSGYLLWTRAAGRPMRIVAASKARTLLVPMLTWNLIFALIFLMRWIATGVHGTPLRDPFAAGADTLSLFTGLTGPTCNLSLFFLRDLFVSSLVVHFCAPLLRRHPAPALAIIAAVAVFDLSAPLIFRPSILLFVATGTVAAQRGVWLPAIAAPRWFIPLVVGFGSAFLLSKMLLPAPPGPALATVDILRRCLLTVLVLGVSGLLVATQAGTALRALEPRIFETYLLHVPLLTVLWQVWAVTVGNEFAPSYLVFFLLAPVVALAAGQVLGALLDRSPPGLQILMRGRVRARQAAASGTAGPAAWPG